MLDTKDCSNKVAIEMSDFKPEIREIFYFKRTDGTVDFEYWYEDILDLACWYSGNCFKTEEEALKSDIDVRLKAIFKTKSTDATATQQAIAGDDGYISCLREAQRENTLLREEINAMNQKMADVTKENHLLKEELSLR